MRVLSCLLLTVLIFSGELFGERPKPCRGIHQYHLPLNCSATGLESERQKTIALSKIGKELEGRFGLCFLSNGRCGYFTRKWFKEPLCTLSFYSQRQLTVEESKAFAQSLLSEYRQRVMANPPVVSYIKHESSSCPESAREDFVTYCLGIKITFWNDDFEYIPAPHIARIDLYKSKLKLYQLLPDSPYLQVVYEGALTDTFETGASALKGQ